MALGCFEIFCAERVVAKFWRSWKLHGTQILCVRASYEALIVYIYSLLFTAAEEILYCQP